MADDSSQKDPARSERDQRLAAQLRENLKKRKRQARARKHNQTPLEQDER